MNALPPCDASSSRLQDFPSPRQGLRAAPLLLREHLSKTAVELLFLFPNKAQTYLIPQHTSTAFLWSWWASEVRAYSTSSRRAGVWTPLALEELCCLDQSGSMSWAIYCLVHLQKQLKAVSSLSALFCEFIFIIITLEVG